MSNLEALLSNNREWARETTDQNPHFFSNLARQQAPDYLWVGCSDSRVPANQIIGLQPGEIFVHRNVGNVVAHNDLNCLSVIQFAVDVLKIKHILVVGHYGCGGVTAALQGLRFGLVDNWLRHVQDVRNKHAELLESFPEGESQLKLLCELNVIEQVMNVCQTTVVQDAWFKRQDITVHGLVYSLKDGLIRDLGMSVSALNEMQLGYSRAIERCKTLRAARNG